MTERQSLTFPNRDKIEICLNLTIIDLLHQKLLSDQKHNNFIHIKTNYNTVWNLKPIVSKNTTFTNCLLPH